MELKEWQRRVNFVIIFAGLILFSFVVRLYQKAVLEHKHYLELADNQYTLHKEVQGQRGEIVVKSDNNYFPLATNERRYQVLAVPHNIKDAEQVAHTLAPLLHTDETSIRGAISDKKKLYVPPLAHYLTRQEADAVASLKLPGILLFPEFKRVYPENQLASQLLGFVNYDGDGNYGLEQGYDQFLKGVKGVVIGQKDNTGRIIHLGDEVKAKDGARIVLTLDREIQFYVEKALTDAVKKYDADSGSVIIMNPKTGAIIAMASVPNFDPNNYNLIPNDKQSVFNNPVLSDVWEPGSVIKAVVMASAIDNGVVEPDTKDTFGASVKVLGYDIFTAKKEAFGLETMTQVLEHSDNVAMVWVGNKMGNDKEYDGFKKFGFGTTPPINLPGVTTGSIPNLKNWNDLTRATTSFGQGMSATPLQLAMAYSVIANNGHMMRPYIVSSVEDDTGTLQQFEPKETSQVIKEDTSKKVSDMLESVVVRGHGKRAGVAGYVVSGKTGTAQVPDPKGGYYDDRHIGSFAGFFPKDPQYAMVVKLDNPKNVDFAESSAAPTFGDIAAWIIHYKQIPPDTQP